MKRLVSVFVIFCMLITSLTFLASPGGAVTHGYFLGDSNDDDEINMKDVLLLRRFVAG